MRPWPLILLALANCHGFFGDRTDEADQELNSFAEARQRAATFYDGGDYARAAAQYQEALKLRPDHFMTQLGLAYSLMYANLPTTLGDAEKRFLEIGERRDPKEEVKRVYGLGLTYRSLGVHFDRRAHLRERKGEIKGAAEDAALAKEHAVKGITWLSKVMDLDRILAAQQEEEAQRRNVDPSVLVPYRVSASLTPDAHLGIAHCEILLMDPSRPEEIDLHFARARDNLAAFAEIAGNARKFWEVRRERLLVLDPMQEQPGGAAVTEAEKQRYEERIANTIRQEVAVRRTLFETLLYVNRYPEAIDEAGRILELDADIAEVVYQRAIAYQYLNPPDYASALRDLKDYRSRLPRDRLTDELVRLNQEIKRLEREIAKQEPAPLAAGR
jgi:tetratricopeptide (TPR) repeat protein